MAYDEKCKSGFVLGMSKLGCSEVNANGALVLYKHRHSPKAGDVCAYFL